jgi:hypothetical protein
VHGWLAATLVAAVLLAVPVPPWLVETVYSRGIYPFIQRGLTTASNLAPFAVLDVLIALAVLASGWRVYRTVRLARTTSLGAALGEFFKRTLRAASVIAIVFVLAWGANYRRVPLERALADGEAVRPTVASLAAAVGDANTLAAHLRGAPGQDAELTYPVLTRELPAALDAALNELGRPRLSRPGRPKFSLVLTPFFTWAGVNGMVDPLVLESLVHPDLLPFERPFGRAHEWAHLSGAADEAEASAIGWLACMKAGPGLAYSARLYLILEAGGALPAAPRRAAFAHLDPGVRQDLVAIGQRAALQKPTVEHAATRVYDTYLRANRVEDGAASYSRALRLILSDPLHQELTRRVP